MKNNKNKLIPTAAYVRVSHDEQVKHGFSIEAQKEGLQKYAEEKGYIIIDWYIDEGKSARKNKGKRKEYLRLIEDAKSGKFEMIIFKCIDRWFRNISEYYKTQSILDDKGINWECSEEEYDTTTRDGRWKLHIYLMLAQDEADKTSERINYVFENKIKNKEAITGSQPYGFIVKEIDGVKRVVKDHTTMAIVQDIFTHFELYNSKRATLYYIQDKYNIEIDYKLITKILKNTIYYGHYKGVDNYVYDEPYITKKRYNKIQIMLNKNVKERKNKVNYIFSGLLKCSCCGNNLTGSHTVKIINKAGEKRTYISYKCNHAYQKYHCTARGSFSEFNLENKLVESIEDEIDNYICNYELSLKNQVAPKIDTKSIKEEMDRLNKMYQKNRIDEKEYDYEFERLEKKLENAQKETPKKKDLTPLYDFLTSGWRNIYHTLSSVEKRALWRSVIDTMTVDVKAKKFTITFI
jgi:DNA invertase Pin-like site-specific DNA recombinase